MEPLLHSRLRLAATCIADEVGVKRSLAQRVVVEFATIVSAQPYAPLIDVFARTVRALPRLRPTDDNLAALLPLECHRAGEVRMEATRLLANIAEQNRSARAACERLLTGSTPTSVATPRSGSREPATAAPQCGRNSAASPAPPSTS